MINNLTPQAQMRLRAVKQKSMAIKHGWMTLSKKIDHCIYEIKDYVQDIEEDLENLKENSEMEKEKEKELYEILEKLRDVKQEIVD